MSARVLILEDDLVLAEMFVYLLESSGFEVKKAATAGEALALAPAFLPKIMLVDISLPDGNGLDVLESLRKDARLSGLRAFVMSTQKSRAYRERAAELGALAYWAKPFEPQALVADVEKAAALP